jgi:hypothetical protein
VTSSRPRTSGFDDERFMALCDLVRTLLGGQDGASRTQRAARIARQRPLLTLRHGVAAVRALPRLTLPLTASPPGGAIRSALRPRLVDRNYLAAMSVLALSPHMWRGRSRQALRTNCSRAEHDGVQVVRVDQRERALEHVASLFGGRHASDGGIWYRDRIERAEGEFWFAVGPDGTALALAEVIADRHTAMLRSLISSDAPAASHARYLLVRDLADDLVGRSVSHLVVGRTLSLPRGLLYFQRLLGFESVNVVLADAA